MSLPKKMMESIMEKLTAGEGELKEWVRKNKTIKSIEKLPGDASTRKYYRIFTAKESFILMKMEPFEKEGKQTPFLIVQKHLHDAGVDVPAVLEVDPRKGFILLEDLGDVTLLRELQSVSSPAIERHLYQGVIDALVELQFHASPEKKPAKLDAYKLKFDHEKLMWEVRFTFEHFYKTHLKREIKPADFKVMEKSFSQICKKLADEPTVLTHRDFHSRNIMVTQSTGSVAKDQRLVMIDFQDARMGPAQYDLASLLRDSYYQLDEAQIARLLDYYIARWEAISGHRIDQEKFFIIFDLMSVQRNFKAIGSFASFLNRRGNATYLKYIGNTFENIRRTLNKYPEYSPLREVLFHYYYF